MATLIKVGSIYRSVMTRVLYSVRSVDGEEVELFDLMDEHTLKIHKRDLSLLFHWVTSPLEGEGGDS